MGLWPDRLDRASAPPIQGQGPTLLLSGSAAIYLIGYPQKQLDAPAVLCPEFAIHNPSSQNGSPGLHYRKGG